MIYHIIHDTPRGIFGPSLRPFYDELESSRAWIRYVNNAWLVSTDEELEPLHNRLSQHLLPNDILFIIRLSENYFGSLPIEAWDWIEERIRLNELNY